jgi:hypothetical protein
MQEAFTTTSKSGPVINVVRGVIGAALGGTAGYFIFGWLLPKGYYAGMAPGALLGIGCGLFVQRRNMALAIFLGVAALALGVFAEWSFSPFARDGSLEYFLTHLPKLPPVDLLMLGAGGLCGFWFSLGSRGKAAGPGL